MNEAIYHHGAHGSFSPALRLAQGAEPPLGAHLVTPRFLYEHHGLYAGHGRVIHYSGSANRLDWGPVEEVSLQCFARGRGIWIAQSIRYFEHEQILARARSRLGERRYRLLTNNCEHFCHWCLSGESHSPQVEAWMSRLRALRNSIQESRARITGAVAGVRWASTHSA